MNFTGDFESKFKFIWTTLNKFFRWVSSWIILIALKLVHQFYNSHFSTEKRNLLYKNTSGEVELTSNFLLCYCSSFRGKCSSWNLQFSQKSILFLSSKWNIFKQKCGNKEDTIMPVDLWTQLNLHKLPEVAKIRKGPTIWFRLPLGILKMLVSFGKSQDPEFWLY